MQRTDRYRDYYLEWMGGASDEVCVFGESAGAMAIHDLLVGEKGRLFDRAILQSATSYSDLTYREPRDAFRLSADLGEKAGCVVLNETSREAVGK